jgi:hypothetical protein
VFVRAVDLAGFAHALKSGKPGESMLPGITAWTAYHPSAGFTICDIRTTVQWDADAPPPTVNESSTVPTDDELYAIQEEDAYAAAKAEAYSAAKSEAYAAKARLAMDNDLDEPLGKACSLDNPECESCQ